MSAQKITEKTFKLDNPNLFVPLDDQFRSIQYIEKNGNGFIYSSTRFLDRNIYIFDYNNTKFEGYIPINDFGPDNIEGYIVGVFVINPNNILVFIGGYGIYKINSKGKILSKKPYNLIAKNKTTFNGFPFIFPTSSGYRLNDKIYFTTGDSQEYNLNGIGYILDVNSLSSTPLIEIADLNESWYGSSGPYMDHHICVANEKIYLALPYKHEVLEFSNTKELLRKIQMNSKLIDKIKPLGKRKREISSYRIFEHAGKYGFYGSLIYNKYTQNFYRITYAPVSMINSERDVFKDPYIEVFDSDFNHIQQFKITEKYSGFRLFTSPDGLCLLDEEKYSRIDNELTFDCYRF